MLFVTYYELNEGVALQDRLRVVQQITAKGLFPAKGVEILRWDITCDNWGVALVNADDPAAVERGIAVWRAAVPGFFKCTRTAPALPIAEALPLHLEVVKSLG
jgi:hypothetical protein